MPPHQRFGRGTQSQGFLGLMAGMRMAGMMGTSDSICDLVLRNMWLVNKILIANNERDIDEQLTLLHHHSSRTD